MTRFLLGRDVLKGLGIDVEQQLAQLAGPSLLEDETDEFPVGDAIPVPQDAAGLVNGFARYSTELQPMACRQSTSARCARYSRYILTCGVRAWARTRLLTPSLFGSRYERMRYHTEARRASMRRYKPNLFASMCKHWWITGWLCRTIRLAGRALSCRYANLVRKPGTQDKFRLTIDYRPVNGMTVPIAGTMPSVATTTDGFQSKKVFGRVDFTQGFWQLSLDEASREMFSFITPDGVFTPNRVPQGAIDSALHFQSQVQTKLAPLIPHSELVWVDDVILFAPTVEDFLVTLRAFFEIVRDANFKLNMAKSSLFELEIL